MIEHWLGTYGYGLVIAGTFLEGETVLLMAGFLAHRGHLNLGLVALAAFVGSLGGDQLWFYLGRAHGRPILERRPAWRASLARVHRLLERHPTLFILGFRFLYGMRIVSPFAVGTTALPTRRFVALNLVGAAAWSVAVAVAGYLFGAGLELALGEIERYELVIVALIAVVGVSVWLARYLLRAPRPGRMPRA